jgi:hypothetical protein
MALAKKEATIVKDIATKYGNVLDLKKEPSVLIEILRNYGRVLDDNGGGGTGGVSPSSIAGSGPPPTPPPSVKDGEVVVQLADVMKAILKLHGDVKTISKIVKQLVK